jgi:hypothetical protein
VKAPYLTEDEPDHSPLVDAERQSTYRKCVGHAIYLGIDRYDCQSTVSVLGKDLGKATEFSWRRLVRFARYLIHTEDVGVWLGEVDKSEFPKGVVTVFGKVDTDWAGCKTTRRSTTSKIVYADGCQLYSQVKKQSIEAPSSGVSEFYGLSDVALDTIILKHLYEWLGFRVDWRCGTDSSTAKAMAQREGVGKVRHLDLRSLWIQRMTRDAKLKIIKLNGKFNPADLGTKIHSGTEHERLMTLSGMCHAEGLDAPVVEVNSIENTVRRLGCASRVLRDGLEETHAAPLKGTVRQALLLLVSALLTEQVDGSSDDLLPHEGNPVYLLLYEKTNITVGMMNFQLHTPTLAFYAVMSMIGLFILFGALCFRLGGKFVVPEQIRVEVEIESEKIVKFTVGVQSQVTYMRDYATPRFVPLPDKGHGAWCERSNG